MKAADSYNMELVTVAKKDAGPDAKAPAVYLNDRLISVIGGIRKGRITFKDIADELVGIHAGDIPADPSDCECCGFNLPG